MQLNWPYEGAAPSGNSTPCFIQPASNICLDFHGDPRVAPLAVFSDGNHHMALAEALALFRSRHPALNDIFYATTPPRVIVEALKSGSLLLGNLKLSVTPHVFISPAPVLERLRKDGHVRAHRPFAKSRGSVMLVRKGNPKRLTGIADLAREDVRIFLSNPATETMSYEVYAQTLRAMAARRALRLDFLDAAPETPARLIYGEAIHHREAPQCLADERADVAVVFYHLALRYTRIFSDVFEIVPLTERGESDPDQVRSITHIGLSGDGGEWGARLVEFMLSEEVAAVYRHHGLLPVL